MPDILRRCVRGRSWRELLLLGIGLLFGVRELLEPGPDWANCAVYFGATAAFALRLFPARAVGVGTALSAIAQRWSALTITGVRLADLDWSAYAPFVALALLCSADLVAKFDDAPTGIRWLPNLWGKIPRRDARLLRWCAYSLAIVGALLFKAIQTRGWWGDAAEWQPQAVVAVIYLLIALLAVGRAPALLAIPPLGIVFAIAVARELPSCAASLAAGAPEGRPEYALPAVIFSLAAALLALPFAIRLLRATLRSNPLR